MEDCIHCGKTHKKEEMLQVGEYYFNPPKKFYVCNEECLKYFLGTFRR